MNILKNIKYIFVKSLELILFSFCFVYSQSYQVRTYTEDDGLPSSEVYDVTQDHSGRMWFATRNGVTVYDGNQWKTQTKSDGLPVTAYSNIECDSQGTIWTISHFNDFIIAYLNGNRWVHLPKPDFPKPNPLITAFKVSIINDQPVVTFGTSGLGLYMWSNNDWKIFNDKDGLSTDRIYSIDADTERFYLATEDGLFVLHDNIIDSTLKESIDFLSSPIFEIAIDKNYNVNPSIAENELFWLLGQNWIGYLENGVFKYFEQPFESRRIEDIFLTPDNHGGVYFGSPYSIFHFSNTNEIAQTVNKKLGLVADGATAVYVDYEKNLWFASFRGVSKLSNRPFSSYYEMNGLLSDETTAVWEIEPGSMVFGHNNGITFLNNNQFKTIELKRNNLSSAYECRVQDIRGDKRGNIWVAASFLGLAKIDRDHRVKWYDEKHGLPGQVNSVLIDKFGSLWAATSKGVFTLQGSQFIRKSIKNIGPPPFFRRLFQGPDNSIYVATADQGIFIINDNG